MSWETFPWIQRPLLILFKILLLLRVALAPFFGRLERWGRNSVL